MKDGEHLHTYDRPSKSPTLVQGSTIIQPYKSLCLGFCSALPGKILRKAICVQSPVKVAGEQRRFSKVFDTQFNLSYSAGVRKWCSFPEEY